MIGIGKRLAPAVYFLAAFAGGGILQAQTITIGPAGYLTAAPLATQQFTATIAGGMPGAFVNWFAGGKAGGNSTVGTIDSTGLYKAPAVPTASGQIPITAKLNGSSTISATTYIYLVAAGPTITSVAPNPIPAGTRTITITGSGFIREAQIWVGGVAYGSNFVNSTTISTSIYLGPATTSTTVTVRNPGTAFGNMLTIPVTGSGGGGGGGGGQCTCDRTIKGDGGVGYSAAVLCAGRHHMGRGLRHGFGRRTLHRARGNARFRNRHRNGVEFDGA